MESRSGPPKNGSSIQTEIPFTQMEKDEATVGVERVVVTRPMTPEEEEEEGRRMDIRIQEMLEENRQRLRELREIEAHRRAYIIINQKYWDALIRIQIAVDEMEGRIPDPKDQMTEIPSLVDQLLKDYAEMKYKLLDVLSASPDSEISAEANSVIEEKEEDIFELKDEMCELGILGINAVIETEMNRLQETLPDVIFTLPSR